MGFSGSAPENKPQASTPAATQATPAVEKAIDNNEVIAVLAATLAASTDEVIAVIAATMAICTGEEYIAHIGRLNGGKSWTNYAKMESATIRNQMF